MDFKNLSLRSMILIVVAVLILLATAIIGVASHGPTPELSSQSSGLSMNLIQRPPLKLMNNKQRNELPPEDIQSMKEMKEQMDNDRLQQKKIKVLKLQLEQTNLQLEREKALSEISKLEKENMGIVNVSDDRGQDKYPDIKVLYIGGTAQEKEAILSINGNNYSVKEKNKPVKSMQVLSITGTAVVVHFNLPQELTATIEFKPE